MRCSAITDEMRALLHRSAPLALAALWVLASPQPAAAQTAALNLSGVWTSVTPPGTGGRCRVG